MGGGSRPLAVAAVALAVVLTGCTLLNGAADDDAPTGSSSSASPTKPPPGSESQAKYYAQRLLWSSCDGGQCADLTVPLSYEQPDGESLKVKLLRVPAILQGSRIGSLVINPGGPGVSGVEAAQAARYVVGEPVRERYDIVGFDPRGVGRSAPIDCLGDRELDRFLGMDPTPDSDAEIQTVAGEANAFARACEARAGPLLGHVSTQDAAKDMDVLRAALGEAKLNYLGFSYGTYLGATYAGLFPKLVGQFVLDGAIAPDLTSEQLTQEQAEGFELASRAWAQNCITEGDCPLGRSVDEVMEGVRDFLKSLDASPIESGDPKAPRLTEGWGSTAIAAALYDQGSWDDLTWALRTAIRDGDGRYLMAFANSYVSRTGAGRYTSNLMEANYAVNCLDLPEPASLSAHEQLAESLSVTAPTWGPSSAWLALPCQYWPVKPKNARANLSTDGSGPIVVVGTTRDPATPYDWSVRLNNQLANSSLITFEGDGHTAYMRSNACVNDAINAYYVEKTVPRDGLRC